MDPLRTVCRCDDGPLLPFASAEEESPRVVSLLKLPLLTRCSPPEEPECGEPGEAEVEEVTTAAAAAAAGAACCCERAPPAGAAVDANCGPPPPSNPENGDGANEMLTDMRLMRLRRQRSCTA